MVVKLTTLFACLAMSTAHAESDASSTWIAQPASAASTGASVRIGAGQVENMLRSSDPSTALMMFARAHVSVIPQLQLELSLGGELGYDLVVPVPPTVAATWMTPIRDTVRVAVRGIASPAITSRVTPMPANRSSSLLAHDPLVAWSAAHSLALQAAIHGDAGVRWGVAASVIELVPSELPRHQTLVRVDAGLAGFLAPQWTWALEIGATSDALDEEYDEGTDIVPLWTAGVHHHRGKFSVGVTTTDGWVGGTRGDLLGPSAFIDMRGPL